MKFLLSLCCTTAFFSFTTPVLAQRDLKDIPPPDPELERKTFVLPEGFEVNLYAADPRIAKPIHMNFDPQGRLWIASSEVYPHIKPGEDERDRVLIVEDTTGDGVADKTTVFAGGLLIPTGVAPGDGGAYVANSTQLLHFADTDNDGRADSKRVVLSGFGTEDTHHILHTLRWAPTGHLYMNQSIYIHSHIETPWGVRRLNAGGIWRFRPESLELDVFMRGLVNSWGHAIDQWGQSFATDGAGGEGINYVVPGAYYFTAFNAPRILHGLNPGSPKHCGLEFVSGRHFPADWDGNLITHDFRGHRVCRFVLSENGSGYTSRQEQELIKSNHQSFRPVDVKMGPDGAIYIADWYNPIIQHGEVDFRDPRRDHTHGRIWRVTYKGNKLAPRPNLVDAGPRELVAQLASPEGWTRQMAHQVIRERGQKMLPAILDWTRAISGDDAKADQLRLEGFWALQSIHAANKELLEQLLNSNDGRIRAAAIRAVTLEWKQFPELLTYLARGVRDKHPRVRLECVRGLAQLQGRKIDDQTAVEIATRALEQPMDVFLDYALWLTCRETQSNWMPQLRAGTLGLTERPDQLVFALRSVGTADAARSVLELLEKNPQSGSESLAPIVAAVGSPQDLARLLKFALQQSNNIPAQAAVLKSLATQTRNRRIKPAGDLSSVVPLLSNANANVSAAAIDCAGVWKIPAAEQPLLELTQSDDGTPQRNQAIRALSGFTSEAAINRLKEIAENGDAAARRTAISGLLGTRPKLAAGYVVSALQSKKMQNVAGPLFDAVLQRKNGSKLFTDALKDQTLPADIARIGLQRLSGSGRKAPELQAALYSAGSITNKPEKLSAEEMQQFLADVSANGNAMRGEKIYRRPALQCTKCHAIGGAGGRVGPDLISLGASAPVDYIITSLLVPNDKVKENYHTKVVETEDGRVYAGIQVRKSKTHLVLRDANDQETQIPLKSIEEEANGSSIMPSGLVQALPRQELLDLTAFLSSLGKEGFLVGNAPVARRWQVLRPTKDAAFRLRRTSYAQAATDDPAFLWDPAYATVNGELPIDDVPAVIVRNRSAPGSRGTSFARCDLEVSQPGPATLKFNSTKGLTAWLGTQPIDLNSGSLQLERGKQRVTICIDSAVRQAPLRVELVPNESTQAVFVNGK